MSARLMGDSVTASAMPKWLDIKAFYVNGKFAAPQSVINDWHGPKVLINVNGDAAQGGDALDVEAEDAGPGAIPGWYDDRKAAGAKFLAVYSNRDNFDACTAALDGRPARRWLATLDGTVLYTFHGIALAAVQAFPARFLPSNFDLSIVFDDEWHPGVLPGRIHHTVDQLAAVNRDLGQQISDLRQMLAELSPPA